MLCSLRSSVARAAMLVLVGMLAPSGAGASVQLSKAFIDDPVAPGDEATLEFTIDNLSLTGSASSIAFSDDLDAVLSGLVASDLPASNVCGPGSFLSGTDFITLTGASLPPAASCTFSLVVTVPMGAGDGDYVNVTSVISGEIDGRPVLGDPAVDVLQVVPEPGSVASVLAALATLSWLKQPRRDVGSAPE